jgi:hypothetical protein
MLFKNIVRKTLGVKNHGVKSIRHEGSEVVVELGVRRCRRLVCSVCGSLGKVRDRLRVRDWRHVPMWGSR